MTSAPPCVRTPCECGACYTPGSVLSDWLRSTTRRMFASLRRNLLRRPGAYGRRGEVLVPGWVSQALAGDVVAEN